MTCDEGPPNSAFHLTAGSRSLARPQVNASVRGHEATLWGNEMSRSEGRLMRLLVLSTVCLAELPFGAYGDSLQDRLFGTWTLVSLTRVVGDVEEPGMLGRE